MESIKELNKNVDKLLESFNNGHSIQEDANDSLKPGDSINLSIEHIKDDLYELDGVQFYKGEDESLQNAVEICIDEDYLNKWIEESDDAISGYFINSLEYDEEYRRGTVEVVLQ